MTSERLVNLYPEASPSGREQVALRSTPGLVEAVSIGAGSVRAMLATTSSLYAVCDRKLIEWDGATAFERGSVADGPATMAWNGTELAITVGGNYYIWDGTTLDTITGGAFSSIGSVEYVDTYFTRTEKDGSRLDVTGILDGKTLLASDFASAEHAPDNIVRVVSSAGLIWYMGTNTVEPWQNVGSADFPFAPVQSTVIEKGLRGIDDVALLDNTFFWISSEGRVYRHTNFSPVRISTHAVEAAIKEPETRCFAYQHDGHDFLVVRCAGRPAYVYDAATQSWHERSTGTAYGAWDAVSSAYFQNTWYVGTDDGSICTLSGYQDRGQELRREATSRNITNGGNRFVVSQVDVRCSAGAGGTLMSQYSRDGGRTWSRERQRDLGAVGEYDHRQKWHALGQGREFCFRLAVTDNVDFGIFDASVNGQP